MILRFGAIEIDEDRFELRRDGEAVPVQGRVLDTILFLARSSGRLVTKSDLMRGPWQGATVSDSAFNHAIMLARRALGDSAERPAIIATVRGKGFRFRAIGSTACDGGDRHRAHAAAAANAATTQLRTAPTRVAPLPAATRAAARPGSGVLAARLGHPSSVLEAHLARAQQLQIRGDAAGFAAEADAHARIARATRHPGHLWLARVLASARAFRAARLGPAASLVRRNLPAGIAAVGPLAEVTAAGHLLNLALELSGEARAHALVEVRTLAERRLRADPSYYPLRTLLAVTRLQLGDRARARRDFDELAPEIPDLPEDRHLLPCLVNLVDLAIAFRDWRRLGAIGDRMRASAGLWVSFDFSDWGPVTFHLGRIARESGDAASARRCFERAVVESAAAESRCWEAWADHARARVLLESAGQATSREGYRMLGRVAGAAGRLKLPALVRAARASDRAPSPAELRAPRARALSA